MSEDKDVSEAERERFRQMELQVKEMRDLVPQIAKTQASGTTTPDAVLQTMMASEQTDICQLSEYNDEQLEEINNSRKWELPVDWSKSLQKATKTKYGHKSKSAWLNSVFPQIAQELRAHGPKFVLLLCGDPRIYVS